MEPKKPTKKKRHSTFNFPTTGKNLDKLSESEKGSKRKSSHVAGDCPIININNNSLKSTILSLNLLTKKFDYYQSPKFSSKQVGPLKSFSYTTYQGLYKEYNEDRVSACSLIKKPTSSKMKTWPKISYFAIFDGHGGEECSDFLNNNFMNYLVENANFPFDIKLSMIESFQKIEEDFFKLKCKDNLEESDKSGSCALVAIIFDNKIYMANLGDSRAIMSIGGGTKVRQLTVDHKPDNL